MWMLAFAEPNSPPPSPSDKPTGEVDPKAKAPVQAGAAGDEELLEEDEGVGDEVNATLMAIMPWAISLLFHAAIVLLAVFIVWSVGMPEEEEEVLIPDIRLTQNPGTRMAVTRTERTETTSSARRSFTRTQTTNTLTNTRVEVDTALIGAVGASTATGDPFGTDGTGDGPDFFGVGSGDGGNVRRIAFLIDASGSLLDTFPFVVDELGRFIRQLREEQSFTVIFFKQDQLIETQPRGLRNATSDYKNFVIDWINPQNYNIIPGYKGNPLPAIQEAIRYDPQLIYILSDNITGQGIYEIRQEALISEIKNTLERRQRDGRGQVLINTIQFVYPDPLEAQGKKGTLEQIAEMSGGIYRFVPASDLHIE